MSYDIYLYVDGGAGNGVCAFDRNYTSNVAPMWREAGADLAQMDGMPAWRAIDCLTAAVEMMRAYPDDYRKMEPDNGWGSYDGCLQLLSEIKDACEKYPKAWLSVSC